MQSFSQSGRSMLEMICVLSVVAALTLGGIWGFNRAQKLLLTNKLKDQVSTLVANVRASFFTQKDYHDLNLKTLISSGYVPSEWLNADKTEIIHSLKGTVLVGPASALYDPGSGYVISGGAFVLIFNGLDSVTCREIAGLSWGGDNTTGFLGMSIKNDGDLTIESSKLAGAIITTDGKVFAPGDLPQALISQTYETCACLEQNNCAIAWKFR